MNDLPDRAAARWSAYLKAEQDRVRGAVTESLNDFIESLETEEPPIVHAWAFAVAESVADHGAGIPVRFPLFRRVLLPALIDGVLDNRRGCARWLAHFESHAHHSDLSRLPPNLRTSVELLRHAVNQDASDDLSRRCLVRRDASYLEYTIHEVPAGVLYGANGATAGECTDLLEFLMEFKGHIAILGERDKYADLVRECRHHYVAYRDYLLSGRPYGSYERFLDTRSPS